MDLNSINLNDAADTGRKQAAKQVAKNLGTFIDLVRQNLQTQTGGNEYELEALTAQMVEAARNGNLTLGNDTAPRPTAAPMALGAGNTNSADDDQSPTPEHEAGEKLIALVGEPNVDGALAILGRLRNGGFRTLDEALEPLEAVQVLVGNHQFDAFLAFVTQKAEDIANGNDAVRNDDPSGRRKTLESYLNAQAAGQADATQLRQLIDALVRESHESRPSHGETPQAFVQRVIAKVKASVTPAPASNDVGTTLDEIGHALGIDRGGENDVTYLARIKRVIGDFQAYHTAYTDVRARLAKLADANSIHYTADDDASTLLKKIVAFVNGGRRHGQRLNIN